MTVCPQCKGQFPIAEGLDFHTYAGIGTAVDGMKTACGAKLIATQQQMLIDDAGGGGGGGNSAVAANTASPSAAPGHSPAAAPAAPGSGHYRGAFRAVDERSGEAVAGLSYRIELPDGRTVRGVTDADGHTQQISSDTPDTIKLYWEAEAGDA
jgi:hypothetical protein